MSFRKCRWCLEYFDTDGNGVQTIEGKAHDLGRKRNRLKQYNHEHFERYQRKTPHARQVAAIPAETTQEMEQCVVS